MNLYVWPAHAGLESIDPECLTIITYVKIAQAPVNIFSDVKPWYCADYSLPFLRHSLNDSIGLKHIIPYFRKENYGIEYNLSDEDLAKLNVLTSNIHQDLIPAVDYFMWCHKSNFNRVTCRMFGEAVGFPMSLVWSNILKNRITKKILSSRMSFQTLTKTKLTEEMIETTLYDTAKRCLTSLEYILSEKEFFIANKPTYIDAVLYGYLWPIVSLDYENDALLSHLRQCIGIMALLAKIHQAHYAHRAVSMARRSNPSGAPVTSDNASLLGRTRGFISENWVQIRNSSLFVVMVSTMMICYAKSTKRVN